MVMVVGIGAWLDSTPHRHHPPHIRDQIKMNAAQQEVMIEFKNFLKAQQTNQTTESKSKMKTEELTQFQRIGLPIIGITSIVILIVSLLRMIGDIQTVCGLAILVAGIALYFLPSMLAAERSHRNVASIVIINILLGWTLIGWLAALLWAIYKEKTVES